MKLSLNTGAGRRNTLTGRNSSILTGCNNTVSANYAAVLGGQNNIANQPFSAVFGNGLATVSADTFHVSCLNAVGTQTVFAGAPSGTVMWRNFSALLPTDRVLVIAP